MEDRLPVPKALREERFIALSRVKTLEGCGVVLQRARPLARLESDIACLLGIGHASQPLQASRTCAGVRIPPQRLHDVYVLKTPVFAKQTGTLPQTSFTIAAVQNLAKAGDGTRESPLAVTKQGS